MITRPTFIVLIEAIQRQEEHDNRIGEAVDVLSMGDFDGLNNNPFKYATPLVSNLVHLLEAELGDQDGYIYWWLWEAPKAGKDIEGSTVMRNGREFVIRDAGDLYDWMRFESRRSSVEDAERRVTEYLNRGDAA